ncbi:MAG TPA: hypothetical protein VEY95_02695 [Azospirillaceae bacterium]|nr:hypothetical protein [Azospirillaceae bacterium]
MEVTDEISAGLRAHGRLGIPADIRTGHAGSLPFAGGTFDYLLTWNSCYYMSLAGLDF